MNLFIDTNVFLSFFHFTSDDLEELRKLSVLIKKGDVVLYLPEQVISEFRRNREYKIADALKRLQKQKLNLQYPQLCKDYAEYKKLRKLQKEYESEYSKLQSQIRKDINNHDLKADKIIGELFENAKILPTTKELMEKARNRMEIGEPPGKKGSLGDAINWEILKDSVPNKEDIFFVGDDVDYYSKLDENNFKEVLLEEWKKEKESNLVCYKRLADFFKNNYPDIELASEYEKELFIRELVNSDSFEETHHAVAKLKNYSEFTSVQLNEIVTAAVYNSQIYWIIRDSDIKNFLNNVISGRDEQIEKGNLKRLKDLLGIEEEEIDIDDLPF